MTKRINIVLPEETVAVLDRVAAKGNRSWFIDRAVLHYVDTHGRKNLRTQLAAGYRAGAERDLATAAEWFPLEEEVSPKVEAAEPKVARKKPRSK
jgi:metal-responsive CopG/Arc/MetJ family transcriptional regulator